MEVGEGLKWIAGTLLALLSMLGSALGVSKLLEIRANRRYALADKNIEIHHSNRLKQIEFDQFAFQKFAERLEKVESELKEAREKLSSQMANNARLEAENKYLKETSARREKNGPEFTGNKSRRISRPRT